MGIVRKMVCRYTDIKHSTAQLQEAFHEGHSAEWGRLVLARNGVLDYDQICTLPRIFVSIGLSTVYQGVAYVITNSKTISGLPDSFKAIGQGTIFHPSLTYATILMVIGGIIMSFIMDRTYFGRYVFALGGNESAARLAGINVKRMKYAIGCVAGSFNDPHGVSRARP